MRLGTWIAVFFLAILAITSYAWATGYNIENMTISVQAEDAVKARDQAIIQAQRKAFAQLTGRSEEQTQKFTDSQIARLVSNFSIKGERLAARSYTARFTIRFDPNRMQNFIASNGLDLVEQSAVPASEGGIIPPPQQEPEQAPPAAQTILVLPVLDIGSRRVVWDDTNPWREVWQSKDQSVKNLLVRVPLGDVSDIADIPDAQLLNGEAASVSQMLGRYSAQTLYIVVAKNQGAALDPSGGMALSLYRHDGGRLSFIKKTTIRPRPGYAFDDAVPAAMQMIVMAENNQVPPDARPDNEVLQEGLPEFTEQPTSITETPVVLSGPLMVTVPYQSLQEWVGIQRRLRIVPGMAARPVRVSPSSAEIIVTTKLPLDILKQNMGLQGFVLTQISDREWALTSQ